jgi:XTP/dITP diphosphohydrolase
MKTSANIIYFVTGNENKFREIAAAIPNLRMLKLPDVVEIQSLDIKEVIVAKLEAAVRRTHRDKCLLVEDTGLYLSALNGFPGPLIKFLLSSIGNRGIYDICRRNGDLNARATTAFGFYCSRSNKITIRVASISGTISRPRGKLGFGWDAIFMPHGSDKTFAEMKTLAEKNGLSMRTRALRKLLSHLKREGC